MDKEKQVSRPERSHKKLYAKVAIIVFLYFGYGIFEILFFRQFGGYPGGNSSEWFILFFSGWWIRLVLIAIIAPFVFFRTLRANFLSLAVKPRRKKLYAKVAIIIFLYFGYGIFEILLFRQFEGYPSNNPDEWFILFFSGWGIRLVLIAIIAPFVFFRTPRQILLVALAIYVAWSLFVWSRVPEPGWSASRYLVWPKPTVEQAVEGLVQLLGLDHVRGIGITIPVYNPANDPFWEAKVQACMMSERLNASMLENTRDAKELTEEERQRARRNGYKNALIRPWCEQHIIEISG